MATPGLAPSSGSRQPELESWKEIAAYLGTSVRTVQRWEEQNGLPVHRVMREKRAAIFAYPHELDAWLAQRTTSPAPAAEPPNPAEPPPPAAPPASAGRVLWPALVVLLIVAAALVFAFVRPREISIPTLVARRLTSNPGFEFHPVSSPDGSWVAYAYSLRGQNGITVQSATTGETVGISQHPAMAYSPQWSPDGNSLLFLRRKSDDVSELLRYDWKNRTGPTVVGETLGYNWYDAGVHSTPAVQWTPDGREALIRDRDPVTRAHRLVRLNLGTQDRTPVLQLPSGPSLHGFALSADGSQLAVVLRSRGTQTLHTVPLGADLRATGSPVPVLADGSSTESPVWTPSGDLFFLRSQREVWRRQADQAPQRVPVTGEWPDYALSITPSGDLLWGHLRMDAAIWLYDLARQQPVKSLCDSTTLDRQPRVSPDGQHLLFLSERSGSLNVWQCEIASQSVRALTQLRGAIASWTQWSPDGERIAFIIESGDHSELRVMRRDGTPLSTAAAGPGLRSSPVWSLGGDRLYFLLAGVERTKLQSVRPDGSDLRLETELPRLSAFDLHADGRYWLVQGEKLFLANLATGQREVLAENVAELGGRTPDGRGLYISQSINAGVTSNYTLALVEDGRPPRQLAGAVPEGMGFVKGPAGFALYTRNSDANGDIFRGVFSSLKP